MVVLVTSQYSTLYQHEWELGKREIVWKHDTQSFFSRKATLRRELHGDSFGCILHAVSMSMSTSAHRKTHACRDAHVK
jgi:hypothetical protein